MRVTPIITALADCGFRSIEGALEFAALRDAPAQMPAAYVVPEGEDGQPSARIGVHDQKIMHLFMVLIVVSPHQRVGQARISEQLHELSEAVKTALTGWQHPDGNLPVDYVSGRMARADASAVVWASRFRFSAHIRKG